MTRIAIFLTAIPLAAALAMLFNALLDRRVAALAKVVRRPSTPRLRGLLAFVVLTSMLTAPVLASQGRETGCAEIECSLAVDADRVESLWTDRSTGIVLVSQSRIPVQIESEPEPASQESTEAVADELRAERSIEPRAERP